VSDRPAFIGLAAKILETESELHSVRVDLHPDPKPKKRIRDKAVYEDFHAIWRACLACTWERTVEAHHMLSRAQGGDDVLSNLLPLCRSCHRAYHNGNRHPRLAVAKFLRSEAGEDHRDYLNLKRGPFGAEHFAQKLEA
jgi:cytochrome c553